jgi:excisionase family DNA binding protein
MSIETSKSGDEWLTVQEAAKMTGYHAEYLRLLIREGKITARKLQTYLKLAESSSDRRHGPK